MKIELSECEIEMIKQGLLDHISDYCVDCAEEKPYQELLDKFNKLKTEEANKC